MPSQTAIQTTLLAASYKNSVAVKANYTLINQGGKPRNEPLINWIWLNIDGLQYQYDFGNYDTDTTIILYDRLNGYIGFDTTVNTLDPNAQPPGGIIIITNPNTFLQPVRLTYLDFDVTGTNYVNPQWKGVNPFMVLASPMDTNLKLGVDYILLPNGGFTLLPGGNLPNIYPGQDIVVYSYALA